MRLLLLSFLLTTATAALPAQTVILLEDFEDATITYSPSISEFSDGFNDYFIRTDGSDISSAIALSGASGSFFAAQDIDGEGATLPATLTFSGIDISSVQNLEFAIDLAEDDDGSSEDWDEPDYVRIFYRVDGGALQNLLWIENDGSQFNSAPRIDTDFDGTGDGTTITDAFATFTETFSVTGSTLELVIEFSLDSGDEDIALDNVTLTSLTAMPVELTAFTGRATAKSQVDLHWATAAEVNARCFDLERSTDGTDFALVERIPAANLAGGASYEFRDTDAPAGPNYYRLRQVDFDGRFTLYGPVAVDVAAAATDLFPNPATDLLNVRGLSPTARLTVLDLSGRQLNTFAAGTQAIPVAGLRPGTYLLRITDKERSETLRFVRR